MTDHEELPQSPIDRQTREANYLKMEQDAINMLRHARLQLGLLAVEGMYGNSEQV